MSSSNGRPKNGGRRNTRGPTQSSQWITEFFKDFLSTAEYRHNLKKRILAGEANHMEILGHYYAFGNPGKKAVVNPPPPRDPEEDLLKAMTKEERLKLYELARAMRAMREEVKRRVQSSQSGSRIGVP
jgi:hypothetical protein